MTSNFFSSPDIGIVSCQPVLGKCRGWNVIIWKVKMWGLHSFWGVGENVKMCVVPGEMCGWNVKKWVGILHDEDAMHYAVLVRLGVLGKMWTLLKFSHVTRLDFHSGKSKQIGSHIMMEIYLLVSCGCERRNGRAAYEMSWLSDVKCDSWLHVGSNNARTGERACEIWIQKCCPCTF